MKRDYESGVSDTPIFFTGAGEAARGAAARGVVARGAPRRGDAREELAAAAAAEELAAPGPAEVAYSSSRS